LKIGIVDTESRLGHEASAAAAAIERLGLDTYWIAGGWRDPLTLLGLAGQTARRVELGTSIASVYGVHPTTLAEHALTVNAAVQGRLILGLGTSHRHMAEGRFGESFDKPIGRLKEFLIVLRSLFEKGAVDFEGKLISAHTELRITGAPAPPILVAALSDQSLRAAGRLADGTLTTFIGPERLADHTVPTITRAAEEASRSRPSVIAGVPVCVTTDTAAARQRAVEQFSVYVTRYTAYKATFERQGVAGPADLAVIGDEEQAARHLERFADSGADAFSANLFGTPGEIERTRLFLAALAQDRLGSLRSPPGNRV
jgi:5,10-methylenetetrahydromethanopterin reductase